MNRFLALLLFPLIALGAPWDGILAPERAIDWTTAGIPGGIPTRTTICATLTSSASTSQVQSAIDNCPAGQVVSFGAGTFNIGSINVRRGITLRGQGPTQTYLNITGNITLGGDISWSVSGFPVNWTGGLTRGSTVLTVASTSGMQAGMTIILDELNPAWVHTRGYNDVPCQVSGASNTCGRNAASPWFGGGSTAGNGDRAAGQMNKVVSVDSATQITVKDPVAYTHTAGLSPQVFFWTYSGQTGNWQGAGVENMKVYSNGNNYTVDIAFCDYCYVKNLSINQNSRSAVRAYWSYGFVMRDSYISSTNTGAPTQYGFEVLGSSHGLVENNIAYTVTSAMMPQSNYGVVFAYNYVYNRSALLGGDANEFAAFAPHLAHQYYELWEGNVGASLDYDMIWGSGSHSTMFRNRFYGHDPGKTRYTRTLEISAYNRFMNVVGNVLGDPTYHTTYRCRYVGDFVGNGNDLSIYDLAEAHGCSGPNNANVAYDPVTYSSLMRWGNWDAVTYKDNGNTNGIRYCTGSGLGNSSCTEDERGSGDPTFPALSSPSSTFPPSFYMAGVGAHASCGTGISFWKNPTSGTCPPFPPIGPDVACTVNCQDNAGSRAAKIPAQICYEQSAKDANGYLTAFDAATCYSPDTGIKPTPPTSVTVH